MQCCKTMRVYRLICEIKFVCYKIKITFTSTNTKNHMESILKAALTDEKVKFTYTSSAQFEAINVTGKKVAIAKSILYVLNRKVIFVQPLGNDKFEILFN